MATGVVLDDLAQARVKPLQLALERDFGMTATQKDLINGLVFAATAAQAAGMISAFIKARATRDEGAGRGGENEARGEPSA